MNIQFSLKTLIGVMLLILVGCSSSQEDILGKPSTTTEAVLMQSYEANKEADKYVMATTSSYVDLHQSVYEDSFNVRSGIAELAPRAIYLPNPRRVLYFYPRLTSLGSLEPGYAIEYPTYKEIHVAKP